MKAGLLVVAEALACGAGRGRAPDDASVGGDDTAVMVWTGESPVPLLSAEEVGETVLAAAALGAPVPGEIFGEFKDLMAEGDELCPGGETTMATHPQGCTADSGYTFLGNAFYEYAETQALGEALIALNYTHSGDFEIYRPDGARFAGAGGLMYMADAQDGVITTTTLDVAGSWSAEYLDDWLGQGFSGVYSAEYSSDLGDTYRVALEGGISVGQVRLHLQDAVWDTADGCGGRFNGSLSLRDETGYWYKWTTGGACSACGELTYHGDQDLGELCVDLDGWGRAFAEGLSPFTVDERPPGSGARGARGD